MVLNDATRLDGMFDTAWQAAQTKTRQTMKVNLETPNRFPDNNSAYDTVCHLAESGALTVSKSGIAASGNPFISFDYKTRNTLNLTMIQSLGGKELDPRTPSALT
jgi:hypothetical protein